MKLIEYITIGSRFRQKCDPHNILEVVSILIEPRRRSILVGLKANDGKESMMTFDDLVRSFKEKDYEIVYI